VAKKKYLIYFLTRVIIKNRIKKDIKSYIKNKKGGKKMTSNLEKKMCKHGLGCPCKEPLTFKEWLIVFFLIVFTGGVWLTIINGAMFLFS